jgi:hypothetical protein
MARRPCFRQSRSTVRQLLRAWPLWCDGLPLRGHGARLRSHLVAVGEPVQARLLVTAVLFDPLG